MVLFGTFDVWFLWSKKRKGYTVQPEGEYWPTAEALAHPEEYKAWRERNMEYIAFCAQYFKALYPTAYRWHKLLLNAVENITVGDEAAGHVFTGECTTLDFHCYMHRDTDMQGTIFFARWYSLGGPDREEEKKYEHGRSEAKQQVELTQFVLPEFKVKVALRDGTIRLWDSANVTHGTVPHNRDSETKYKNKKIDLSNVLVGGQALYWNSHTLDRGYCAKCEYKKEGEMPPVFGMRIREKIP
eukprot:TRINITY_DN4707_c0_g2_i1.p1 TRINITY_DN4707_c0_g2~~TRINITY_DN4707_c0_g2_i1.p1  ORF type:complete len:242 (+),score=66.45 TRINITY_DN4707_c0_g2_i1:181-906(+)